MWTCQRCAELLGSLVEAFTASVHHDLDDGALRHQITLATHIAGAHCDEIPPAHADCQLCDFYQKQAQSQGFDDLWAEHRARDLFLPPSVARLL